MTRALISVINPVSEEVQYQLWFFNETGQGVPAYQTTRAVFIPSIGHVTNRDIKQEIENDAIFHMMDFASQELLPEEIVWLDANHLSWQEELGILERTTRVYSEGTPKINPVECYIQAEVSGGVATFNLTDDGLSNGNAIFTDIFPSSIEYRVDDDAGVYRFGEYSLAGNKKTLSVSVTKQTFSSGNALLDLMGGLGVVITGQTFPAAANGTVVYLKVKGEDGGGVS